MTEQKKEKSDIERAADERREELEHPEKKHGRPDPNAGAFNPVEGVPPHGASIPEKDD